MLFNPSPSAIIRRYGNVLVLLCHKAAGLLNESKHAPYNAVAQYRDVEVDEKSDLPTTQS